MLDVATRQRIDTARDILVGKVPDPKSQVEQITLALMYKFMDDIDASSVDLGGKPSFFTGDFAQYSWHKIVGHRIGAFDALKLYSEGITKMGENPSLPLLFRSMFNNAYLPYRDPETLRTFLQVINEFDYDNSERMGDAFEYLLSIMGSQGDAGQFRTPRHIIDFIVEIVDPKKEDTILDPACGTAGFLISAYKHIVGGNRIGTVDAQNGHHPGLTPDERVRLAQNVRGYDISPDMVRLSLVNLYLHGFNDPHIYEYDTLTSEDRWGEYANVILANPPFMSPKGGIRPHNRFSVKSKRSEVLFVDYIAEHLTSDGRAGVIVPEGIIFQSQNAHKQLRKMLVQDYLVAVISLPSGIFNPYSGVKTSILILDRSLARRTDSIAFFKVENDGFDLGAQRRPIDKNDLPRVKAEAIEYLRRVRDGKSGGEIESDSFLVVAKERIAEDGEFNLSGEKHTVIIRDTCAHPYVPVYQLFSRSDKTVMPSSIDGPVTYLGLENIEPHTGQLIGELIEDEPTNIKSTKNIFNRGDILYGKLRPNLNKVWYADRDGICSSDIFVMQPVNSQVISKFYEHIFRSKQFNRETLKRLSGAQLPRINWQSLAAIEIPLPPLEVQREIVSEIESYQRVIDGARAVVENWQPRITIDPEWPMVELGTVCEVRKGTAITRKQVVAGSIPVIAGGQSPSTYHNEANRTGETITISASGAYAGFVSYFNEPIFASDCSTIKPKDDKVISRFVFYALRSKQSDIYGLQVGMAQPHVYPKDVALVGIPLPPLEVQRKIVSEIDSERELVDANRQLIKRMEAKVRETVERVWGE